MNNVYKMSSLYYIAWFIALSLYVEEEVWWHWHLPMSFMS